MQLLKVYYCNRDQPLSDIWPHESLKPLLHSLRLGWYFSGMPQLYHANNDNQSYSEPLMSWIYTELVSAGQHWATLNNDMATNPITKRSSCPAASCCKVKFGKELSRMPSGVSSICLGSFRMADSPVRCLHHGTETRALVGQQIWWAVELQNLAHIREKHATDQEG